MRAAVLHEHGAAPRLEHFDEPVEGPGHVVAEVAAGLNHLDVMKASGRFHSGSPPLPSVVGSDGVARLENGRRVFFDATAAPYGALAERTLVSEDDLLDVRRELTTKSPRRWGTQGSPRG